MAFNLEDLLQFINLNPELQAKFTDMEAKITELEDYIKQFGIINDARLSKLCYNALNGQVVKIDASNKSLFADDNFRNIKVVSTDEELADEMNHKAIDLKDVFKTWQRFSSNYLFGNGYTYAQNGTDSEQVQARESWTYDESLKAMCDNGNWNPSSGFISTVNYGGYWIKLKMIANDDDDDVIGVVVAFMTDSKGIQHHLTIIRDGGIDKQDLSTNRLFSLIYDFDNPTEVIIQSQSDYITRVRWNGYAHLYVCKNERTIFAKTTTVNSDEYLLPQISCTLPSSNPGFDNEVWNNIKYMMSNNTPMGFITKSNYCKFLIEGQQELFDDADIYSLHTDEVYRYNTVSSIWEVIGKVHDVLPNRLFLYNKRLHHLFFYSYWNKYIRIDT